jgi:glycosyltransferase involved in cell wall biosynthesis
VADEDSLYELVSGSCLEEPVRVLFMNSMKASGWRGGEKWMVEAAAGLTERGHAVYLAVRPGGVMARRAADRGIALFPISYGPDLGPVNALKIRRFLKEKQIELVNTNFEKENRLVALATLGGRRPVLVARKGLPFIFNKWRYRVIYKHWVKHIVTPSKSIEARFRLYDWLNHVGISVIPNGVRVDDYSGDAGADVLRRSYEVPEGVPLLGFIGDLARQKGVDHLLRALSEIGDPWHLFIIGGGGERHNLERLSDELGLRNRTTFTGHRDDIPRVLSELNLVLSPSLFEGMPNALLEAMAAGRPVVANAVDGITEVVTEPGLGVLVSPGNIGELRDAIASLLRDPDRRSRLGEAARRHVAQNFTTEAMVDRLEGLFRRLLEEYAG